MKLGGFIIIWDWIFKVLNFDVFCYLKWLEYFYYFRGIREVMGIFKVSFYLGVEEKLSIF